MNRCLLLPAVYLLDQAAGDPEGFPHPVRVIGWAIAKGEAALRCPRQRAETEFVAGALLAGIVVAASYCITQASITAAYRVSMPLGWLTEVVLGWTCLAARNLHDEASLVLAALDNDDLPLARNRLARIVGRDTARLDSEEISRAVIETLAESASDGIMAPIFYMSLGGVPLAMAYKAINTLDSMIGYADTRYFYFGKVAARLDDGANLIPARMTALAIAGVSNASAWQTWMRDGGKHKSPNAGQPESAMAGALRVRLGGGNYYDGEFLPAETIGEQFPAPQPDDARQALRIVSIITALGAALGAALGLAAGALLSALHSNQEAA